MFSRDRRSDRFDENSDYRYYPRDQITGFRVKNGSYWKRGMAIGAGAGAVIAGMTLGLTAGLNKCVPEDTDPQICGAGGGLLFGLGGAAAGALIGMGIGAGIGAAIPKKQPVSISPSIFTDGRSMGGIGIKGRF
jgi:hypothetical protein